MSLIYLQNFIFKWLVFSYYFSLLLNFGFKIVYLAYFSCSFNKKNYYYYSIINNQLIIITYYSIIQLFVPFFFIVKVLKILKMVKNHNNWVKKNQVFKKLSRNIRKPTIAVGMNFPTTKNYWMRTSPHWSNQQNHERF